MWNFILIIVTDCIHFKSKPQNGDGEHPGYPSTTFVHLDYLTIESTEDGKDVHMLITDHFAQYAQALVTSLQTAKCTAQALWDQFVVHYGLPVNVVSDLGHNFESDLLQSCAS